MKICRGCGRPFRPIKRSQRYHDALCQHRAQTVRLALTKKMVRRSFPAGAANDYADLIRAYRTQGAIMIKNGKRTYVFTVLEA